MNFLPFMGLDKSGRVARGWPKATPCLNRTSRARFALAAVLVLAVCLPTLAEVRLPKVFSDHMVLQQGKPVTIWGWAAPGEQVTVEIQALTATATANGRGEWKAILPALKAGGPFELVVRGSNVATFRDVLVGEVWLCSGQSNMEMGIGPSEGGAQEIKSANYPKLRLLLVPKRWTPLAQTNIESSWQVCSSNTVAASGWGGFSACAYYFGHKLQQELDVPVGLIDACWGGTRIEPWTPPEGFAAVPALQQEYQQVLLGDPRTPLHEQRLDEFFRQTEEWLSAARKKKAEHALVPPMPTFPDQLQPPHDLQNATALCNGMIHPLCPFTLAGAIWYQGESNLAEGKLYFERMKALIQGWRLLWGQGDFPFNYVQIAPFNYGGWPEVEPELWEAQAAALSLPNTGMAVINDIGNLRDIHPTNKRDVGQRLALIALARTYGRTGLEYSGPTFRSLTLEDGKLRVAFDHAEGLRSRDGKPLTWFDIIDAEHGGFVRADAVIETNSVVLSASAAPHPVAMRFAWSMLAEPNLMNAAGLPASAFRAGPVPKRDSLEMDIPESRDYTLVYDLDLAKAARKITYNQDHSSEVLRPFDRIAYFLELRRPNAAPEYLYVSMKAFTADAKKIGVPTGDSGARFQQNLEDMNVFSNVRGVVTGSHLSGGNIEFWPSNYGPGNSAKVPGASSQTYDFGDAPGNELDGYGSMQVHNHDDAQTLFAFNHWSEGQNADLGIGNNPSGCPDWTFAHNAASYSTKRLRVLVHYK